MTVRYRLVWNTWSGQHKSTRTVVRILMHLMCPVHPAILMYTQPLLDSQAQYYDASNRLPYQYANYGFPSTVAPSAFGPIAYAYNQPSTQFMSFGSVPFSAVFPTPFEAPHVKPSLHTADAYRNYWQPLKATAFDSRIHPSAVFDPQDPGTFSPATYTGGMTFPLASPPISSSDFMHIPPIPGPG